MAEKFVGIKGMNDILPASSFQWLWLESKLQDWLNSYGYKNIRTPILENTKLFCRSIGEVTDIVEKEMYSFVDSLNGDTLTMRPEGTVGTLRAVLENNLLYNQTQKLWYIGPMFRHERPQKGRYRQFHQLGAEALGFKGPDVDCEIILMLSNLWQILGLNNIELHINCLGNKSERLAHREALIKHFEKNAALLDEETKRRLYSNPLRILDSKNPALSEIISSAPRLIDYLEAESLTHYNSWKKGLTNLGINYIENPRLVRGLDYYNLSVFEWISSDLGAQSTVCGGGRYDPLIAELGSKDNYAIGFAIGIERLLLSLESQNKLPREPGCDVYIVSDGNGAQEMAFDCAITLRRAGFSIEQNLGGGSFKSQFKRADNSNASLAIVIGENEVKLGQVVIKSMSNHEQVNIPLSRLVESVQNFINS